MVDDLNYQELWDTALIYAWRNEWRWVSIYKSFCTMAGRPELIDEMPDAEWLESLGLKRWRTLGKTPVYMNTPVRPWVAQCSPQASAWFMANETPGNTNQDILRALPKAKWRRVKQKPGGKRIAMYKASGGKGLEVKIAARSLDKHHDWGTVK